MNTPARTLLGGGSGTGAGGSALILQARALAEHTPNSAGATTSAPAAAGRAVRRRGRGKAARSLALIAACRQILEEIQPASVRAVCYQLFVKKLIADVSKASTARVSTQLTWARENRYIRWSWIVDETREAETVNSWEDPAEFMETVRNAYRKDFWAQQPFHIEIWSEKGTVRGTLGPILDEYGLTFRVMHGFTSATVAHQIAQEARRDHRPWVALYVGDWDPSGLYMSERDLPERIDKYGGSVHIQRLAIDLRDTFDPDLPHFEAKDKEKDARYRWFVENFGDRCWELDALSPRILRERVRLRIEQLIDREAWERCEKAQAAEQQSLRDVLDAWKAAAS
jgi:hypothetical protein